MVAHTTNLGLNVVFFLLLVVPLAIASPANEECRTMSAGLHTGNWRMVTGTVTPDRARALWGLYTRLYGKVYHGEGEETKRFNVFSRNVETMAQSNNEKGRTFWLGINEFSDLTFSEFASSRLSGYITEKEGMDRLRHSNIRAWSEAENPDHIDWRERGAISPVGDQGNCGSCWLEKPSIHGFKCGGAFASVACLEAHHFIKTNKLLKLSEQDLIDCGNTAFDLDRCFGGDAGRAYKYIAYAGGLGLETDIPYLCKNSDSDECRNAGCRDPHPNVHAPVTDSVQIYGGESEMEQVVASKGPIVVAITANELFQHYAGGIFEDPSCVPGSLTNHAVAVIGYSKSGPDGEYWILKNSHGDSWGECGYIRFRKGNNMCSISKRPVYPVL